MEDFYDINDKDIESMVNYLRIFQPEDANKEFATEFLKYMKLTTRRTGRIDPDELDKQLEAYNKSRTNKED